MSHIGPPQNDQETPVVPARLRTVLYIVGTLILGTATAVIGQVDDVWVRLATGFGTAALAVAFGYRPTR
jgi:small-conductance mechanosensitive channel